jgi:hypothetical protein
LLLTALIIGLAVSQPALAAPTMDGAGATSIDHLVISEVMTGGASASDEFVELYNPGSTPMTLDGHELVYVTASGATITRKAIWGPGVEVAPGAHVLVGNEAGIFAGVADVTYANGLAATGGSMALRLIGAATAVDAVGWGTAASTWREGSPAPAPPAGSSLERLPGGELGSGQDSGDNLVDFVVRGTPDPQNSASPPVPSGETSPSGAPSPSDLPSPSGSLTASPSSAPGSPEPTPETTPIATPDATPSVPPVETPTPVPSPTPTPAPTPMTIAEARAMPDGATVVVVGTTLTDSAFSEGGGYLADATGGITVLLAEGAFPRGVELLVRGTVDDRFSQRTIRAAAGDVAVLGLAADPDPLPADTGLIGEPVEGQLVALAGVIDGAPTVLTSGLAYDVDDGSGPVRVLIGPGTGIDTTAWEPGATVSLIGVVGQRDSSGTGADGYRVQPRDPRDVISVLPPATPEPTPSPSPTPTLTPSPSPSPSPTPPSTAVISIADARAASVGAIVRIRGVVTLPTGLVETGSAVIADPSGAILIRSSSNLAPLRRGQLVELTGTRSTRSGMASVRIGEPALVLGTQPDPAAPTRATGQFREADEALLVVVRGVVGDGPRRTSGGSLTLTLNDGSGELRVFVAGATGITAGSLPSGSWVEVRGVVGQQTTGSAPTSGYRLWPRDRADVRVIAPASGAGGRPAGTAGTAVESSGSVEEEAPPAPMTIRPRLGGAAALLSTGVSSDGAAPASTPLPGELQAPLAVSLAGLAGLVTLAWRHGTWTRLHGMVGQRVGQPVTQRVAALRTGTIREKEDESYTLAP